MKTEEHNRLTLTTTTEVIIVEELHKELNSHPDTNGHKANTTDPGHNFLQVGDIVCGTDQSSSPGKVR
jgi:hypothetical protein